jgi:hypothetical protein
MNSIEILKSSQLGKLLKIFRSSLMQSLDIFEASKGLCSKFESLASRNLFGNLLNGPGQRISDPAHLGSRHCLPPNHVISPLWIEMHVVTTPPAITPVQPDQGTTFAEPTLLVLI